MKRTKILLITHSAVLPTGMAETTRLIFNTLLKMYPDQYEIHQIGLNHVHAVTLPTWPIYPTRAIKRPDGREDLAREDRYGEETFRKLLPELQPDIVFAFNDPHAVEHLCEDASQRKHKLILYVNFDGFPVPPDFDRLFLADRIFTMSEFAKKAFLASHPKGDASKVDFMYSPADTERFKPVSPEEKRELRRDLFPEWMPQDAFVLGWVGMNQWRKQSWVNYQIIHLLRTGRYHVCGNCQRSSLLDSGDSIGFPMSGAPRGFNSPPSAVCPHCATKALEQAKPMKDVFLWLHMQRDPINDAWPVDLLENLYDVRPGRDLHYTEGCTPRSHLAPEDMPALYQLWDGLLYLSGGEGFGIPAWEAMCSGIPVIYTNYSSHAEFLGLSKAGIPIGGRLQPEPKTTVTRFVADVAQAIDACRWLISNPAIREHMARTGRNFTGQYPPTRSAESVHGWLTHILANRL